MIHIQEIKHDCKLLQKLAKDMNLPEEIIAGHKKCKKLEYAREEFGNNERAWECEGCVSEKGDLYNCNLRQMNKDIANITKIHWRRRSSSRERSPPPRF